MILRVAARREVFFCSSGVAMVIFVIYSTSTILVPTADQDPTVRLTQFFGLPWLHQFWLSIRFEHI